MQRPLLAVFRLLLNLVHVALLAMAVGIVLMPSYRSESVRAVFFALLFASCSAAMFAGRQQGHLKLTFGQLFDKAKSGGGLGMGLLDKVSTGAAAIAAVVLWMN